MGDTVTQEAVDEADHAQSPTAALSPSVRPAPPSAGSAAPVDESANWHACPDCTTETGTPATSTVPVREMLLGFGATSSSLNPGPLLVPPAVTVIHGT